MSRTNGMESDLLGRMPRHRARGRSPLRPAAEPVRDAGDPLGAMPAEEHVDLASAGAQTAADAVRMAAEVADIALTAAALMMRQLLVELESKGSAADTSDPDSR